MKTLKKTLCLILAVVMAVGVLVIPANAAYDDFTDKDAIEHTTAVAVLSGMGIIAGKDTGAYDPQGTLTREEAAKLVVYALLGPTSAEQLDGSTVTFPDVPTTNWANKYITYAAQAGIINGVGDGNFNPKGTLTGYELAKLLLVAAGVEGSYTGNNWKNEVMLASNKAGLLADTDIVLADVINRDDAAQLIWNAVNYSPNGQTRVYTVYLENGAENSGYDPAEDTYIWDGTDATSALIQQMVSGGKIWQETVSEGSLGDVVFGLKPGSTTDDWGRPVSIYTNGKASSDPAYKLYASFTSNATKTYTAGVTLDKVLSDVGYKSNQGPAKLAIVEDGVTTDNTVTVRGDDAKKVALGGYGSLVDVLKDGNNVTIYVINTYVAKIDSVSPYKAATADRDEEKAHVTIKVGDKNMTFNTDKFAKNDIVLYTINKSGDGKIVQMELADSVSGKVTATNKNGDYITVDGTRMYKSKNAVAQNLTDAAEIAKTAGYTYNSGTTFTFYKDFNGNVITVKEGVVEQEYDYIYVDRLEAQKAGGSAGSEFGFGDTRYAAAAKARVIHLDTGNVEIVNVAIARKNDGKYYYANLNGAAGDREVLDRTGDAAMDKNYYRYAVLSDGSYALVPTTEDDNVSPVTLKRGNASLTNGLYANGSTSTTVISISQSNRNNATKTTMTGYNSFPGDAFTGKAIYVANSNGVVSELYIVSDAIVVQTAVPVNYAVFAGMGDETDVYNYGFIVNGEYVEYSRAKDLTAIDVTPGHVYDITVDNGALTAASEIKTNTTDKDNTMEVKDGYKVTVIENEYFIAEKEGTELFTFASEVLVVDAGENYAKAELGVDDVVTAYVHNGKVEFIIIAA